MLAYFKTDPVYTAQFKEVWLWNDWSGNGGRPDTGIDLVAENLKGDGFTAIQCKFYAPNVTIEKKDIDSFFNESGKEPFTRRLLVSTTHNYSIHAENSFIDQTKPSTRIGLETLDESSIDWNSALKGESLKLKLKDKKVRRPHQITAINSVIEGLKKHDRGKLIMACGTGKTYTAQCITEDHVKNGGSVLVLVPSISLLSQTVKEWASDASKKLNVYAVCSDPKAGRKRNNEDLSAYDLIIPATTDTNLLVENFNKYKSKESINVIFSTYQSLPIVAQGQKDGLPEFDLIICDEAHRTVGLTLLGDEDSNFTKVHNNDHIKGKKRLYMTATPRVYSPGAKAKAKAAEATYASMDDYQTFGEEFYRLRFYEAVNEGLLSDYKVLILTVNEDAIASAFQQQLSDANGEIKLDDATKIVGCLNAFAKHDPTNEYFKTDKTPMKRVVAFSNTIANSQKFKRIFNEISERFHSLNETKVKMAVEVKHIDGTFNSFDREELLGWLKLNPEEKHCNVLTNARCLTEGVDVPSLDAIVFLEPRNSMVDVIQAVGRVMRKSPNKEYGYVILPIGIPSNVTPEQALDNNERFSAVWTVLNALRSHDERLDAEINKLDLSGNKPENIEIIPVSDVTLSPDKEAKDETADDTKQLELTFPAEEIQKAIYAKLVEKVGTRIYLEKWAQDVAEIVNKHEVRIKSLLKDKKLGVAEKFEQFLQGLRANINESVTQDEAISMLSQHLITKPIFDTLFKEFKFVDQNPVSKVMENMIEILDFHSLDKERESLNEFYAAIQLRVEGIDNNEGRQKIMTELYERFFKLAFPKLADQLGIVYTPVEVVDFILNSIEYLLVNEFNTKITNQDVQIFDPFTGTGTFIARLLAGELIDKKDLLRKFTKEIHANEIVLLAYYIAAINIESILYEKMGTKEYKNFEGIVLTDTFQMYEENDLLDEMVFIKNNERVLRQKSAPINVIVGNPPYSVGQKSQNDNAQNLRYPTLDRSISNTYAIRSKANAKNALYDSYIRAFRLASDRIGKYGIVGFVSNGSFLDSKVAGGFRQTLQEEFSGIYIVNLRGNQRTSGEQSRREGGKIFGSGSRTQVALTFLIRNPSTSTPADIYYFEIGDYLSRENKLKFLKEHVSVESIPWIKISPDRHGDWINQQSEALLKFDPIGDKSSSGKGIFSTFSLGIKTNRDYWIYSYVKKLLTVNIKKMLAYYDEVRQQIEKNKNLQSKEDISNFIKNYSDPTKISWDSTLLVRLRKNTKIQFNENNIRIALYRPYNKKFVYFDRQLINSTHLIDRFFPHEYTDNHCISINVNPLKDLGVIMSNVIPDFHLIGDTQCFPLYIYEIEGQKAVSLFDENQDDRGRRYSINDSVVEKYSKYFGDSSSHENIFFYVYGLLHSKQYRDMFKTGTNKAFPRIPIVEEYTDLVEAGKRLSEIHTKYEEFKIHSSILKFNDYGKPIEKIRIVKNNGKVDKTKLLINNELLVTDIPEEVYDYRLSDRSALEWVIDRYRVTLDKESNLTQDPNQYNRDINYVLNLLGKVISVSLETNSLIKSLHSFTIIENR